MEPCNRLARNNQLEPEPLNRQGRQGLPVDHRCHHPVRARAEVRAVQVLSAPPVEPDKRQGREILEGDTLLSRHHEDHHTGNQKHNQGSRAAAETRQRTRTKNACDCPSRPANIQPARSGHRGLRCNQLG